MTLAETSRPPQTVAQHFLESARKYGAEKIAIRQKRRGLWLESTWQESYEHVKALTLGLVAMGMQRGDRVAILGDNDREYIWADLAVLCAGGAAVGIFADMQPEEIEYIVNHSGATFVMAKDQEQVDKLLEIKRSATKVKKVIYWDPQGMWAYHDDWLVDYKDVLELGCQLGEQDGNCFEELVAAGQLDDPATICYTSGTTGLPKGAVISNHYLIFVQGSAAKIDPRYPTDNHVSFLSLSWIAEHVFGVMAHAVDGVILNYPEKPETLQENIREVAPEELLLNSRLWENLVRNVQVRIADSTWLNQLFYRIFLPIGAEIADRAFTGKPLGPWLRLKYALGNVLLYRPLRDQLGLARVRSALTTGAALSPEVLRFFKALGITLRQVYGATEAGVPVMHRENNVNFYSVGTQVDGYEVQISSDGEVLIYSPALFLGYHNNVELTEKVFYLDSDDRRWFRTGDAGRFNEDGHLIYFDRLDAMIRLASGESYSPQYIEGHLKFNPNIRDVMTVGGGDLNEVTAIITLDFETVGRWAEKRGLAYTTFADLSQKLEVLELLRQEVERVNKVLPSPARVRRFVSLYKEFDADEGEMTRTRKLRRGFLQDRYQEIIDAMYNGLQEVDVVAPVQYRDGRSSTVKTTVKIVTMEEEKGRA